MKTTELSTSGSNMVFIVLGILAAALVFLVLTGRRVPLLNSDRAALLALVVIGMAICSQGIGKVAASGDWLHPLSILSHILGFVVVVIGAAALFGRQVPPLDSYYHSFITVTAIALFKVVLTVVHSLLR